MTEDNNQEPLSYDIPQTPEGVTLPPPTTWETLDALKDSIREGVNPIIGPDSPNRDVVIEDYPARRKTKSYFRVIVRKPGEHFETSYLTRRD